MNASVIVAIVVVLVVAVGGLLIWDTIRRRRTRILRDRFGPEYDQTVVTYGGTQRAERELAAREKRVKTFHLHPLAPDLQQRFTAAWKDVQTRFVDDPSKAVAEADALVKDLLQARGYPVVDFEQPSADISVDHPHVVSHYRAAREVALSNREGRANTEDLRRAMVHYRALFEDVLEVSPPLRRVGVR
jgi:hypothetical protein